MNDADRKLIQYQCRAGFVVPSLLFFSSLLVSFAFLVNKKSLNSDKEFVFIIWLLISLVAAILISFIMNRKYYQDLRFGEKECKKKIIQNTIQRTEYEAGSGVVGHSAMEMKAFTRYDIIVENIAYQVEVDFYLHSKKGDAVLFYYASKSRFLLGFELEK